MFKLFKNMLLGLALVSSLKAVGEDASTRPEGCFSRCYGALRGGLSSRYTAARQGLLWAWSDKFDATTTAGKVTVVAAKNIIWALGLAHLIVEAVEEACAKGDQKNDYKAKLKSLKARLKSVKTNGNKKLATAAALALVYHILANRECFATLATRADEKIVLRYLRLFLPRAFPKFSSIL